MLAVQANSSFVSALPDVYPFSEVEPQKRNDWFWHDSEGNRDATKTTIASRYMFTSSLENTLSQDYFTEKRYQVNVVRRFQVETAGTIALFLTSLSHSSNDMFGDVFATVLQALFANSVPLVFKNHNSEDYLPGLEATLARGTLMRCQCLDPLYSSFRDSACTRCA